MFRWLLLSLLFFAPSAFSAIERVTYFVNDANGSPLLEINSAGLVIAEAEYQPYGEPQEAVRRVGREATIGYADSLNQQDGIQAMGVRLYAPELGRFISPDPVTYLDGGVRHFGRYHYANNNPYKYVDRDGEAADIILDVGFIAYSAYTLANEPSWINAAALGADVVGAIVPFATGLGHAVRGGAHGVSAATTAVSNPVPGSLVRVIPEGTNATMLGRPDVADVFVTSPSDIAGMNASQIARRLAIPESPTGFRLIEFSAPPSGLASPVFRTDPGFIGGGRTMGGAREFVIPNQLIPNDAIIRSVR